MTLLLLSFSNSAISKIIWIPLLLIIFTTFEVYTKNRKVNAGRRGGGVLRNALNFIYRCSFILAVWIVGLLTYSAGSKFVTFIFNKSGIDQAYYYFFGVLLNGDSNKYAANYGIAFIICTLITSIIYYLVLKYILFKILKLNRLENYFYSNLKLLNNCMTFGVLFFGFFPLYLSLVKFDGDLTKEINLSILSLSIGFFVPSASLLLESIYRLLAKENEEMERECSAEKRNDIPSFGNAEEKKGRVLSESIREKNYKVVTDSNVIMKDLNKEIFKKKLNEDFTKKYLNHLENNYTLCEIKLMKQTLENEISTKSSLESKFIAAIGVVMVLITAIITVLIDFETDLDNIRFWCLIAILIVYIALIFIDFFWNQSRQIKKVKLLNHLNLKLALKKSYGENK